MHSLFYPQGTKIIPNNIYDLLTPIALAHLIMGDGSVQRSGLIICTDSYTLVDVVRLMNVLIVKYSLDCTMRRCRENQYRIYIGQNSMTLLIKIVSPYMYSSMLYKLKSSLNTPIIRTRIEVLDVKNNIATTFSSMSEGANGAHCSAMGAP